jgi:CBS domain-containing membrane protein
MQHTGALVSAYMTPSVRTLPRTARLAEAHAVLREHALSALVVTAGDEVVGVLSRTDLLRVGRASASARRDAPLLELPDADVASAMSSPVASVSPETSLREAAREMLQRRVHRLVVRDGRGRLAGVLSTRDLMAAVRDRRVAATLGDYMTAPVLSVDALDTVAHATDRLQDARVAGVVVLEDGRAVGLFTQTEALQSRELAAATPVEDVMNYALVCLDRGMTVHRAAANALATRARRIVVVDHRRACGVVTGLDFARVLVATDDVTSP